MAVAEARTLFVVAQGEGNGQERGERETGGKRGKGGEEGGYP